MKVELWQLIIPALVPVILAVTKAYLPNLPKFWLPILAPIIGAGIDIVGYYAAGGTMNPISGAVLGGLGVWLREVGDQLKKRNDEKPVDNSKTYAVIALASLAFLSGCITPTGDPLVVRTEQTLSIASESFDLFLKLEYQNRQLIKEAAPNVFKTAERFRADLNKNGRQDALDWLDSANTVKRAYKLNRAESNRVALITMSATIEAALNEAQSNLAAIAAAKSK